jgi:hypothetical protein
MIGTMERHTLASRLHGTLGGGCVERLCFSPENVTVWLIMLAVGLHSWRPLSFGIRRLNFSCL